MPQLVQVFFGVLLSLLFVSGCGTPWAGTQNMLPKNPFAKKAPTAKTPVEIVDVWNSYALPSADGTITRGMLGRVHFYDDPNRRQAIKVDGDLSVFVFDGRETDPAYAKPLKVFQFGADVLEESHSYQQPLGHGYNFFLPFDEIGGEEKPLSLIVRFDDNLSGKFELGAPVNTVLAGRRPQTPTDPSVREFLDSRSMFADTNRNSTPQSNSEIQQVGYVKEVAAETQTAEPENSRVITIPLNSDMARRMSEPNSALPVDRHPVDRHVGKTSALTNPQPIDYNRSVF